MAMWSGWGNSLSISNDDSIAENEKRIAEQFAEEQLLKEQQLALAKEKSLKLNKQFRAGAKFAEDRTAKVVGQAAEVSGIGLRQGPADLSSEQRMLGKMFGQGEKIWGVNNQPVTLNNDLNPSRSNPFDETAGMFGFGGNGERSGLF